MEHDVAKKLDLTAAILGISDLNKTRITTVIGIIPQPDLLSKIVWQLFGGIPDAPEK